jgi:signal transduction histidine kinase
VTPADVRVALIAIGCAVPIGLIGAGVLRWLGHRSITASISVVALVGTASMAAGVVGTSSAMFLSAHDLRVVLLVVAVAGIVALAAALLLGRRLARQSVWERESAARERAAEASRRELVAWVSHDLRTPLAGLRAMAEALEDGVVNEPDQVAAYHAGLRREADRLAGMVDDLFELSRIQAGALRLHLDAVPLADLVSDAVATVGAAAASKRVTIRAEGAADWPTVLGSDAELGRVLRNLLSNAVRHTPADGTIVITAGTSAGLEPSAWLSVQDACGGIPDGDLPRLFDVAFRGELARTPRGAATPVPDPSYVRAGAGAGGGPAGAAGGAGLGLAIARGLVEAHRGTIAVRNATPGCRFTVHLPLTR